MRERAREQSHVVKTGWIVLINLDDLFITVPTVLILYYALIVECKYRSINKTLFDPYENVVDPPV